jgi:catechol 2,3-dioxygenase-like lactoylglutathione lyase family enzyme
VSAEAVVHGLSHVDVPVRDLGRALAIYRTTLGFGERSRGEGWVDLDAGGTIALRLLQVRRVQNRAALRVQAGTVEAVFQALLASGCKALYEPRRTAAQELEGRVADPDGHTLHVWRPLTEDEYDFVPELPKEMAWTPDAEALLKSLLKSVPALFRGLARRKVVRFAEELGSTGLVTREELIRGFILASPRVTRGRNRQPLLDHGVEVDRYQADWDAG